MATVHADSEPDIDHLYARYGTMVQRRCQTLLRDEAMAEDAMQDVFVRLLQRQQRASLHGGGLSSLLYQMATQVCLNRLRSTRRRPEEPVDPHLLAVAQTGSPEEQLSQRNLLQRWLSPEPVSTQVMAVLHYLDGMTLDEVAEATGLSPSGVRKRLRLFKAKLPPSMTSEEIT